MKANRETARNSPPVRAASLSGMSLMLLSTATSATFCPSNQAIAQGSGSIHGSRPPMISSRMPPSAVSEVRLTPSAVTVSTETVSTRWGILVRTGSSRTWFQ